MSQNASELRFVGGNTEVQTPGGGEIRIGSVFVVPANTVWEATSLNVVHTDGTMTGVVKLRDATTTTNVYASFLFGSAPADSILSDNGLPVGTKIGPFSEEVTLEYALISTTPATPITASGIARIQQVYS